ncbi:DUF1255 family protein [Candidatus Peregrinibacteria bacterium]|nr:DUF1255 family protein [Candidatus Peregrinibacteria bacterium]
MSLDSNELVAERPQMIKHNSYYEGRVQSLGFPTEGGDATSGVLEPGSYNFGVASRRESIKVVHGVLCDDRTGQLYGALPVPQVLVFNPGEEIEISCEQHVAYVCCYG